MKNGAVNAAKSIQTEIDKAKAQKAQVRTQAEAETEAEKIVKKAAETMQQAAPSNDELLQDLQEHTEEIGSTPNPAATTFHSAYTASAGSVPTLRVEDTPAEPEVPTLKTMDSHNP